MSSSRNPDLADEYARTAFERGLKVVICSTGLSGHLAAAVAARTVLPVIGVPIASAPQMVGNEALAITAQMPTGVPIATVGVDASGQRGAARVPDPRRRRRGDPGDALEVQGRPRRRARGCDPPLRGARGRRDLVRRGPDGELARDRAARGRGVGRARCDPAADAAACRERATFTVDAVLEREAVTRHDVAAFVDVVAASIGDEGRWIHFGMTSSDVLDTGLRAPAPGRRRRPAGRPRAAARRGQAPGARAPRHGVHRPVPRCPRRAHVVRAQARGRRVPARPRSRAAPARARGRERRRDQRRRRLVRERRPARRGDRLRPARAPPRGGVDADRSSATATRSSSTRSRSAASTLDALATEIRHLARTEVREVQEPFARGAEGLERDAAQAEPGRERARQRPRTRAPRPRARGDGERRPLARARHLALLGRAADHARRHGAARASCSAT